MLFNLNSSAKRRTPQPIDLHHKVVKVSQAWIPFSLLVTNGILWALSQCPSSTSRRWVAAWRDSRFYAEWTTFRPTQRCLWHCWQRCLRKLLRLLQCTTDCCSYKSCYCFFTFTIEYIWVLFNIFADALVFQIAPNKFDCLHE